MSVWWGDRVRSSWFRRGRRSARHATAVRLAVEIESAGWGHLDVLTAPALPKVGGGIEGRRGRATMPQAGLDLLGSGPAVPDRRLDGPATASARAKRSERHPNATPDLWVISLAHPRPPWRE